MIVDCINNDTIINIDNDGVMKEYWQRYKYRFININIKYWYIRIHKYKFYRTWKKENWKQDEKLWIKKQIKTNLRIKINASIIF